VALAALQILLVCKCYSEQWFDPKPIEVFISK